MTVTQTLKHHRDIQNWVSARHGMPGITRVPDIRGEIHARLALSFGKASERPHDAPGVDAGMAPVSWHAWLAELDRQHLALKVSGLTGFEFVELENVAKDDLSKNSDMNSGAKLN
jgi:hypothetical protein